MNRQSSLTNKDPGDYDCFVVTTTEMYDRFSGPNASKWSSGAAVPGVCKIAVNENDNSVKKTVKIKGYGGWTNHGIQIRFNKEWLEDSQGLGPRELSFSNLVPDHYKVSLQSFIGEPPLYQNLVGCLMLREMASPGSVASVYQKIMPDQHLELSLQNVENLLRLFGYAVPSRDPTTEAANKGLTPLNDVQRNILDKRKATLEAVEIVAEPVTYASPGTDKDLEETRASYKQESKPGSELEDFFQQASNINVSPVVLQLFVAATAVSRDDDDCVVLSPMSQPSVNQRLADTDGVFNRKFDHQNLDDDVRAGTMQSAQGLSDENFHKQAYTVVPYSLVGEATSSSRVVPVLRSLNQNNKITYNGCGAARLNHGQVSSLFWFLSGQQIFQNRDSGGYGVERDLFLQESKATNASLALCLYATLLQAIDKAFNSLSSEDEDWLALHSHCRLLLCRDFVIRGIHTCPFLHFATKPVPINFEYLQAETTMMFQAITTIRHALLDGMYRSCGGISARFRAEPPKNWLQHEEEPASLFSPRSADYRRLVRRAPVELLQPATDDDKEDPLLAEKETFLCMKLSQQIQKEQLRGRERTFLDVVCSIMKDVPPNPRDWQTGEIKHRRQCSEARANTKQQNKEDCIKNQNAQKHLKLKVMGLFFHDSCKPLERLIQFYIKNQGGNPDKNKEPYVEKWIADLEKKKVKGLYNRLGPLKTRAGIYGLLMLITNFVHNKESAKQLERALNVSTDEGVTDYVLNNLMDGHVLHNLERNCRGEVMAIDTESLKSVTEWGIDESRKIGRCYEGFFSKVADMNLTESTLEKIGLDVHAALLDTQVMLGRTVMDLVRDKGKKLLDRNTYTRIFHATGKDILRLYSYFGSVIPVNKDWLRKSLFHPKGQNWFYYSMLPEEPVSNTNAGHLDKNTWKSYQELIRKSQANPNAVTNIPTVVAFICEWMYMGRSLKPVGLTKMEVGGESVRVLDQKGNLVSREECDKELVSSSFSYRYQIHNKRFMLEDLVRSLVTLDDNVYRIALDDGVKMTLPILSGWLNTAKHQEPKNAEPVHVPFNWNKESTTYKLVSKCLSSTVRDNDNRESAIDKLKTKFTELKKLQGAVGCAIEYMKLNENVTPKRLKNEIHYRGYNTDNEFEESSDSEQDEGNNGMEDKFRTAIASEQETLFSSGQLQDRFVFDDTESVGPYDTFEDAFEDSKSARERAKLDATRIHQNWYNHDSASYTEMNNGGFILMSGEGGEEEAAILQDVPGDKNGDQNDPTSQDEVLADNDDPPDEGENDLNRQSSATSNTPKANEGEEEVNEQHTETATAQQPIEAAKGYSQEDNGGEPAEDAGGPDQTGQGEVEDASKAASPDKETGGTVSARASTAPSTNEGEVENTREIPTGQEEHREDASKAASTDQETEGTVAARASMAPSTEEGEVEITKDIPTEQEEHRDDASKAPANKEDVADPNQSDNVEEKKQAAKDPGEKSSDGFVNEDSDQSPNIHPDNSLPELPEHVTNPPDFAGLSQESTDPLMDRLQGDGSETAQSQIQFLENLRDQKQKEKEADVKKKDKKAVVQKRPRASPKTKQPPKNPPKRRRKR